jgi:hypothetical protein
MPGAGFAVTKDARRAANTIGGRLGAADKARANRRNRHRARLELQARGEDAHLTPKLWTGWDVV